MRARPCSPWTIRPPRNDERNQRVLEVRVSKEEYFDEETNTFVEGDEFILFFEHSLVSISKWESKWEVPFLTDDEKTDEQTIDYIRCMLISPEPDFDFMHYMTQKNFDDIQEYIAKKMTATWFHEREKSGPAREKITSELIYYWMIAQNVPMECQYWHLNRLLTLIKVCGHKNSPPKKGTKSAAEVAASRRALNEQRKAQYNTRG